MKRLGPELKMPDLKGVKDNLKGVKGMKPPAWLADLYCDMRDRRLLPLVALVAVAIAAVPFLLGGSEGEVAPPVADDAAAGEPALGAEPTRLTVVEAKPGLRNYKKRLKRRSPSDPFAQKYTSVPPQARLESVGPAGGGGGGSAVSVTEATGGGGSETPTPEGSPSGGSAPSPGEGSGEGSGGKGSGGEGSGGKGSGGGSAKPPPLITFVVDVQISRSRKAADGGRETSKPQLRRRVRPFKQLPGKKVPVVTTMGLNLRTGKIMFLVSDQAHSLDGEFRCVARTPDEVCELLEIEPGFLFTVFYGPNRVAYSFKVTKVSAARAGRVGDGRTSSVAREGRFGIGFATPNP